MIATAIMRPKLESYRATNPITEARWVLRSLKRDLAKGFSPLDLAVVMPQRNVKAFLSLADEYDLPIMNEVPESLSRYCWGGTTLGFTRVTRLSNCLKAVSYS